MTSPRFPPHICICASVCLRLHANSTMKHNARHKMCSIHMDIAAGAHVLHLTFAACSYRVRWSKKKYVTLISLMNHELIKLRRAWQITKPNHHMCRTCTYRCQQSRKRLQTDAHLGLAPDPISTSIKHCQRVTCPSFFCERTACFASDTARQCCIQLQFAGEGKRATCPYKRLIVKNIKQGAT